MANAPTITPKSTIEALPIPDPFAPPALLSAALTLLSRALKLEWRVHSMPSGATREEVSDRAVETWIFTERTFEMARDEAEPDTVIRRLAETFLDMMPGSVFSLEQLHAAGMHICEEVGKTSGDPEIRQVAMHAFVTAETMIGNCESTGVPNAGISVLYDH
tara:strand:- start:180 stop:662 length:483 start_codon:yes stop_codon:yes gene_type:complete